MPLPDHLKDLKRSSYHTQVMTDEQFLHHHDPERYPKPGKVVKIKGVKQHATEPTKRRGAPRLYDLGSLDVGASLTAQLSSYKSRNGADRTLINLQNSLYTSSRQHRPKKFSIKCTDTECVVTRKS